MHEQSSYMEATILIMTEYYSEYTRGLDGIDYIDILEMFKE